MEEKIFPMPAVADELKSMVESRLHYDSADSAVVAHIKVLRGELGVSLASPAYVVLDPTTGEVLRRREGALMSEETFSAWLRGDS